MRNDQKNDFNLTDMLRNLPQHEPPQELTPLVMDMLAPKKLSLWRRIFLLAKTPWVITISPFRIVTAAMASVLLFAVVLQLPIERFETAVQQTESKLIPVTFHLDAGEASSVNLIGSFNGWKPEGYAMKIDRQNNQWIIEVNISPGSYEYAFLLDDKQAVPDPSAIFFKNDGFNSRNSVIYVSSDDETIL